jgi:hypothetical protein
VGDHIGLATDLKHGEFRTPPDKLRELPQQASAASSARCLSAREVATVAGKAQFLYLDIAPARFLFLRELHNVLATRHGWGG